MQLILSDEDLAHMSPELREQLFHYLGQPGLSGESMEHEPTPLDLGQVMALLRDVSFHPDGNALRALVEKFAYAEDGQAPHREHLLKFIKGDEKTLSHALSILNRLAARAAHQRHTRLWSFDRPAQQYRVHPTTRQVLKEALTILARSGKGEEPLWEG
jgi:hypothetical protein